MSRTGKRMHDWAKIKHEYVTTPSTYASLARKYDLRRETVTIKGEKGDWPEARRSFIDKVEVQKTDLKATSMAEEGVEFDKTCFTLAKWLVVEAVNERKSGGKLGNTAAVIGTAQLIAKTALGGKQLPPPSGGIEGAESIDNLLEQYGDALGLSKGSDNPADNPSEPLHPAQEAEPEAVPVPVPDR